MIKKKSMATIIILIIIAICFTGCGSGGGKLDAETIKGHAFWYSTKIPDNRGRTGQIQIMFDDEKTATVYFQDSGEWLSGGDCSVTISSSTITLTSLDGDIIRSPLANNGTYTINYTYDKNTATLSMRFGDIQLNEGLAPFCLKYFN